jgi:hypothetical protein
MLKTLRGYGAEPPERVESKHNVKKKLFCLDHELLGVLDNQYKTCDDGIGGSTGISGG